MAHRPVASTPSFRTLGAIVDGGRTTFRVWAPNRRQVELVVFDADQLDRRHGSLSLHCA